MNNTIMIVDDMKLNINLLAECLGDDYIIMPAISGESAIKILERKRPDLILLDILMPGIDGFEVLEFIKSRKELATIPVIIVTGEQDAHIEEKGLMLGAVDYVRKPYNPTVVGVKVKNHLELKAYRDCLEQLVMERTEELEESMREISSIRDAIIMGMSIVSESRDRITGEHTSRIKLFTEILAEKFCEMYPDAVTWEAARKIALYSPLHDVGKTSVSDLILNKPCALTADEFDIIKRHTVEGAELLKKTETFLGKKTHDDLKVAIEIAESHHEKYDGTGYPHGLEGEEIPLSARIVSLVDVYDAIRSNRPYKRPFTHAEAVCIITEGDEKTKRCHFDPRVLEAFMAVSDSFERLYDLSKA